MSGPHHSPERSRFAASSIETAYNECTEPQIQIDPTGLWLASCDSIGPGRQV